MDDDLKTVASFPDPMLAHIAETKLKDNGIEAAVFGENSQFPSIRYADDKIKVKVNAADYDRALSILAASDKAE